MKDIIVVKFFSRSAHCSQLLTGLHLLKKEGRVSLRYDNHTNDIIFPYKTSILQIVYKGKTISFDMMDGYNSIDAIRWFYHHSDFYFKRSYSDAINRQNGFANDKIFPLGFNYHVSYLGNPCEGSSLDSLKEGLKILLGRETNSFFTKRLFEECPYFKTNNISILFYTRLWAQTNALSDELNRERSIINEQRVELIRTLKEVFKENFYGGLEDSKISREKAPDLCLSSYLTQRKAYIAKMHNSDICIGTTGLHNSIGWKMGEYIAAAKGIVSEPLNYSVPGPFNKGENYLEFTSIDSCVSSIFTLYDDPVRLYQMKLRNYGYYWSYLEPSRLVLNCLNIVDDLA